MLRFLLALISVLPGVWWRRRSKGPRRPGWSFALELMVEAMRAHLKRLAALPISDFRKRLDRLRGPLAAEVRTKRASVAGIPVLWFHPANSRSHRLIIYAHGGGYVAGTAEQDQALVSRLARLTACTVAAVSYRLAPEHVAPAARDDMVSVYRALREQYDDITFVGLSAGGGAVLSALVELRANQEALPKRVALLSPLVDVTQSRRSWFENGDSDYGTPDIIAGWARAYAGNRPLSDPVVSPLYAPLAGLPRMLVVVGGAELLRDDALELASRTKQAGGEVLVHLGEAQPHAFLALGIDNAETRAAFEAITEFILGEARGPRHHSASGSQPIR